MPSPDTGSVTSHTLLVVDDEPLVRDLVEIVLRRAGYRVLTAVDGPSALSLAEGSVELDMAIVDVSLPGVQGPALVERLRRRHPGMRVLFVSGHDAAAVRGWIEDQPGIAFLGKPFSPTTLRERVGAMLGAAE